MTIFLEDRPLLEAFRRGDKQALEAVYRFYLNDILKLVRFGFSAGAARVAGITDVRMQLDIAHDLFVKAFAERARLAYDGLRPYRPFIMRIAKNMIVDKARKSNRELALPDILPEDAGEDAIADPNPAAPAEESMDTKRLRQATQEFLASQSEELQRFVQLRFVDEMSQYEVIEAMGITRRRVRTLEEKAQAGLKKHLRQAGLSVGEAK